MVVQSRISELRSNLSLSAIRPQTAVSSATSGPDNPNAQSVQRSGSSLVPELSEAMHQCVECGKSYIQQRFLNDHQRKDCPGSKRSLNDILAISKEIWEARKRRKLNPHEVLPAIPSTSSTSSAPPVPGNDIMVPSTPIVLPETEPEDMDASVAARRGRRRDVKLPVRYRDVIPAPFAPLHTVAETSNAGPVSTNDREIQIQHLINSRLFEPLPSPTPSRQWLASPVNAFGFIRQYFVEHSLPKRDPDFMSTSPPTPPPESNRLTRLTTPFHPLEGDLPPGTSNATLDPPASSRPSHLPADITQESSNLYSPFANSSSFDLGNWYWSGGTQKSFKDFQSLLSVIKGPQFSVQDVMATNWKRTFQTLGANKNELSKHEGEWITDDGWHETEVPIQIPFHARTKEPGTATYVAGKMHHRSIVSVIREVISDPARAPRFHYDPYKLTWQRHPSVPDIGVRGELYTSEAFLAVHEELQTSPPETGCSLDRVVVGLMFWSDSTHLTAFGGAKLWPCYMYFGNESKDRRSKGDHHLCEHMAYFEPLTDDFKDYLNCRGRGKVPPSSFTAFCQREVFHAQWALLLDDDLVSAIKHGIVIKCCDGVERRFYPRIFTYSADYPEKVMIAAIRTGKCPCPRCMIPLSEFPHMAMAQDRTNRESSRRDAKTNETLVNKARKLIFNDQKAIGNDDVEAILQPQSWTPTMNAFTQRLGSDKFDIFSTLVVDLLHEFEIGIWKNLFIHLIRILEALTNRSTITMTAELDSRYRATPTFGRDTIRKFTSNASEMKRKAARDYEDVLQCAIPAFDSLLVGQDDQILMKLLFLCAEWHALAKLRMHNDLTLRKLDNVTTMLANQFRLFVAETCTRITTYELESETSARNRVRKEPKGAKGPIQKFADPQEKPSARKKKTMNIKTYKFHALMDYVKTIRLFGTTDSYSTEVGECSHRSPKSWYKRTNKKSYRLQVTRVERRRARLRMIRERIRAHSASTTLPTVEADAEPEGQFSAPMDVHYTIGANKNFPVDIFDRFGASRGLEDPSIHRFVPKLKLYLHLAVKAIQGDPDEVLGDDWTRLVVENDRLFSHKIMRARYTTYDVRREEDVVHINSSQTNIMVLQPGFSPGSGEHPFRYGKVLGIFHANASLQPLSPSCRVEFLWIRWYQLETHGDRFQLDRVRFIPSNDPEAFGFLDPKEVIRVTHLIPQFSKGAVQSPPTSQWLTGKEWHYYYINKFVDRDMYMRYQWGLAIGHVYTWKDLPQGSNDYYATLDDILVPDVAPDTTSTSNITMSATTQPNPQELLGDQGTLIGDGRIGETYVFEDGQGGNSNSDDDGEDDSEEESDEEDASDWDDNEILTYDEMYSLLG